MQLHPSQVRVVLIETQGDANVGAVARSMACFGAQELYLVRPKAPVRDTAYFWACHARELLESRHRVDHLSEALEGVSLVLGTSARHGVRRYRMVTPAQIAEEVLPHFPVGKVALVFGNEESGMDNDSIRLCHRLIKVPTQPDHSSINLGHTVSIILYELLGRARGTDLGGKPKQLSTPEERQRLLSEVSDFLGERGYPSHQATLAEEITKLGDIVERSSLEAWELRLLMGVLRHLRNYEQGHIKSLEIPR
jgi:tRNA (cytidine32/uridine32-2'-O)-methyltransferase